MINHRCSDILSELLCHLLYFLGKTCLDANFALQKHRRSIKWREWKFTILSKDLKTLSLDNIHSTSNTTVVSMMTMAIWWQSSLNSFSLPTMAIMSSPQSLTNEMKLSSLYKDKKNEKKENIHLVRTHHESCSHTTMSQNFRVIVSDHYRGGFQHGRGASHMIYYF